MKNRYESQHAGHLQGTFWRASQNSVRSITPIIVGILEAEKYLPMHHQYMHVPSTHGGARTFASSSQLLEGLQLKPLDNTDGFPYKSHKKMC